MLLCVLCIGSTSNFFMVFKKWWEDDVPIPHTNDTNVFFTKNIKINNSVNLQVGVIILMEFNLRTFWIIIWHIWYMLTLKGTGTGTRQPLLGKFLWGGIYFLREGAPSGTRAQTCGISTYGPWTGRGGSKWATSSGSKHYHFCQGSVYETSLQAEVEPVRQLVFSPPGGPP